MNDSVNLPIRTPRFLLRDFLYSDEETFVRYQTDPAFSIHHTAEERGQAQASAVFSTFSDWQAAVPRIKFQLAVCHLADDDRLIGSCGVRMPCFGATEADFGVELARSYWGRYGFALEISKAMITWAFSRLQLEALTADTALNNHVAARLARSAGFRETSIADKQCWRLERSHWRW